MSRLEELIQEYCPNGVEYRVLQELGSFFGGLTGKGKDDFGKDGSHFITYMNVFSNIALDMESTEYVTLMSDEKQNRLQLGDVIFTGSSETRAESGMSSVVTKKPKSDIYLNSFCFGFRFVDCELMNPDFSKHIFRSTEIRNQIIKTANGVTRYNISKKLMEKVRIPLPPLPVQEEIVRILDKFTALEAELEAELEARKKQYEYYREAMFICSKCQYYRVMDLTIDRYWLMPATPNFITEKGIPYITSKNVKKGNIDFGNVKYITEEDYQNVSRNREIQPNDVIIGMIGTLGEMAIVQPHDLPFYGQNMYLLRLNFQKINLRYFYHYFDTKQMKEYFQRVKNASSQGYLKANHIEDLSIPLPPLAEQERIVSILDRFDALVNDITQGLPAEIEARRKQYEYYRNQLLTFKEATP